MQTKTKVILLVCVVLLLFAAAAPVVTLACPGESYGPEYTYHAENGPQYGGDSGNGPEYQNRDCWEVDP